MEDKQFLEEIFTKKRCGGSNKRKFTTIIENYS